MRKCLRVLAGVLVCCMVVSVTPTQAEYRIWEGRDGSMVEAEMVEVKGGSVELIKRDGNEVRIPISKLSQNDQAYIKRASEPPAEKGPMRNRLEQLKSLYEEGLITKEVYKKKQQELVSAMLGDSGAAAELPVDLEAGLVLFFGFNEPSSFRIKDESGNGNDGKVRGAEWVKDGRIGGAYRFEQEKRTHGILVEDSDSLDCKSVTVAAWIKTDDVGSGWTRIVDKDWEAGYNLCMGGTLPGKNPNPERWHGKALFEFSYRRWVATKRKVADGKWHHLAGSYNNGVARFYVDGKLESEKTVNNKSPINVNDIDLVIGNKNPEHEEEPETNAYDGLIDEVRIYNRALNPAEVAALFELRE